jgi:tetratricopeptide (TPR) repeat protein
VATYLNRGILYVQLKQYQQAIADFICVLRLDEMSALRKQGSLTFASVTAHTQLGLIYMNHLNRLAAAVRCFTNALRVDPKYVRALLCRAECLLLIHNAAAGNTSVPFLKKALRDYTVAVHLHPNVAEYRLLLGDVYLKLNDLSMAAVQLKTAAAINLKFIDNTSALANIHAYIGNYEVAVKLLSESAEDLLAQHPSQDNLDVAAAASMVRQQKLFPLWLQLGAVLMQSERHAEAISVFEKALAMRQTDAPLFLQIGICLAHEGDDVAAMDALTCAIKLNGRLALAFYHRGLCKLRMKQDKGIQDINTSLALDSALWQAYLTRASYYSLLQRYPKAILNCNEAIKLQPQSTRAYLVRGCLKVLMHHYSAAIEDFTVALKLNPGNGLAVYNRGLCYQHMGKHARAVRDFSTALLMESGAPRTSIYLSRGTAHYRLGDYANAMLDLEIVARSPQFQFDANIVHTCGLCLHRMGRLDAAIGMYTSALQRNPRFLEAYIGRGNAYMDFLTADAMARSRRDFSRAIHLAPKCLEAYVNLAYNLQACGNLQQAWVILSGALRFAPQGIIALEARAIINLQMSNFSAAMLDLTSAIAADQSAELRCNRGVVYRYMGNSALALADFQAAVALNPGYALAHYNMATSYLHQRQLQQALTHFTAAVDLQPGDDAFHLNRSVVRVMMGDRRGALEDLNAAAAISPAASHVLYNRGCLHASMNSWGDALEDFTAYLKAAPMDARAYEQRARAAAALGRRAEALKDHARAATIAYGAF